ncbi:MAG TPA: right-handed parallel beta-helix repeat-containing protein [Candidatus Bathyarchaeia archaeon]|nr:right-handed parallel beta-helix repeat-containing protein [Candidatus Bathyarchaeia archaeon]
MRSIAMTVLSVLALFVALLGFLRNPLSIALAQNQVVVATPGDDPEQAEICAQTLDAAQIEACRADGYLTQEPDPRATLQQSLETSVLKATEVTAQASPTLSVVVVDKSSSYGNGVSTAINTLRALVSMGHKVSACKYSATTICYEGFTEDAGLVVAWLEQSHEIEDGTNFCELTTALIGEETSPGGIFYQEDPDHNASWQTMIWTDACPYWSGCDAVAALTRLHSQMNYLGGSLVGSGPDDDCSLWDQFDSHVPDGNLPLPNARFVSLSGNDRGNCSLSLESCRTIQYAADQSDANNNLLVSEGEYTDLVYRSGMTQTVYLDQNDQNLTIFGSRDPDTWDISLNPTIANPHQLGRGITISGTTVSLDSITVINGNGYAMPFPGYEVHDWWRQMGGGLLAIQGASVRVQNSEFALCSGEAAGGLAIEYANINMDNCYLHDNNGDSAIDLYEGSNSSITGSTFEGNGNGVFLFYSSGVVISKCHFLDNTWNGVRLYGLSGTTISHSSFAYNNAGVHGAWANDTLIEGAELEGNGYGAYCAFCERSRLVRTRVSGQAFSGVFDAFSGLTLENTLLEGNLANGLESWGGSQVYHSNVVNNNVGLHSIDGGPVVVKNSIVSGNSYGCVTETSSDFPGEIVGDTNVVWQNDVLAEGSLITLTHNLEADPLLDADSIHIHPCSPVRNAGANVDVTTDYDGDTRPDGSAPEIGMDEVSEECIFEAPVANNDNYSITQNMPLIIPTPGVLGNDTDPDSSVLTATLVSNPSKGTLVLKADGSFVYTPTLGSSGVISFTYAAYDGLLTSNVATVTINVEHGPTTYIYLPLLARDFTTLNGVQIDGPEVCQVNKVCSFTAAAVPANASGQPFTYTWIPTPQSGQGTNVVSFRWSAVGPNPIVVTLIGQGRTLTASKEVKVVLDPLYLRIQSPDEVLEGKKFLIDLEADNLGPNDITFLGNFETGPNLKAMEYFYDRQLFVGSNNTLSVEEAIWGQRCTDYTTVLWWADYQGTTIQTSKSVRVTPYQGGDQTPFPWSVSVGPEQEQFGLSRMVPVFVQATLPRGRADIYLTNSAASSSWQAEVNYVTPYITFDWWWTCYGHTAMWPATIERHEQLIQGVFWYRMKEVSDTIRVEIDWNGSRVARIDVQIPGNGTQPWASVTANDLHNIWRTFYAPPVGQSSQ